MTQRAATDDAENWFTKARLRDSRLRFLKLSRPLLVIGVEDLCGAMTGIARGAGVAQQEMAADTRQATRIMRVFYWDRTQPSKLMESVRIRSPAPVFVLRDENPCSAGIARPTA